MSFIQALGAEALVRGVGDTVPYENGGIYWGGMGNLGPSPPIIEKIVTNFFFAQILVKISQPSFPRFQTFSEQFEKNMLFML